MSVQSQPGQGTTFSIELPEALEQPAAAAPTLSEGLQRGTETIVLVEDQAEVSRASQLMLRKLGYTVHAFRTGEELLGVLDQVPHADLLLSDVVLPGISGPALADKLVQTQPWLRVLFASGYHEESLSRYPSQVANVRVLGKPFSLEELSRAVRDSLQR